MIDQVRVIRSGEPAKDEEPTPVAKLPPVVEQPQRFTEGDPHQARLERIEYYVRARIRHWPQPISTIHFWTGVEPEAIDRFQRDAKYAEPTIEIEDIIKLGEMANPGNSFTDDIRPFAKVNNSINLNAPKTSGALPQAVPPAPSRQPFCPELTSVANPALPPNINLPTLAKHEAVAIVNCLRTMFDAVSLVQLRQALRQSINFDYRPSVRSSYPGERITKIVQTLLADRVIVSVHDPKDGSPLVKVKELTSVLRAAGRI